MEERQTRRCVTDTVVSPYRDNPHLERPHVIEVPLRGSISREAAAALPSSSLSAATEGAAARGHGDRDAPLFFPNGIGSGVPPFFSNIGNGRGKHGGAQACRPRHSPLLPHRQWHPEVWRHVGVKTATHLSSSPTASATTLLPSFPTGRSFLLWIVCRRRLLPPPDSDPSPPPPELRHCHVCCAPLATAFAECEAMERRCGVELAKCGSNLCKLGEWH
jgi:hypothetical protein